MLYTRVLENLKKNKKIKDEGGFVGVPVPFSRMSDYIPSWEKGHSIQILGATGSGKSRLARYMFIYHVYRFYKQTGYKVKILFFPLEDSKEKVYNNIICNYLKEEHGIFITLQELQSKGGRSLPAFVLDKLEEAHAYFEEFEEVVNIIDGRHRPSEIYDYCEEYALKVGEVRTEDVIVEGAKIKQPYYTSNDDTHVFVIVDNMSNLETEKESPTERETMIVFAKKYIRERLCNFFHFTVVQVVQSDFATERQQFNKDGQTIVSKLEPSLASIGEAKTISRSAHVVIGLFDPSRYDILRFPIPPKSDPKLCYDIDILGNRFRSLKILKNNDGDFNFRIGVLFNAISETFEELPPPKSVELEAVYSRYKEKRKFVPVNVKPVLFKEEDADEAPF
jgi:hypothetical protein